MKERKIAPDERWLHAVPDLPPQNGEEQPALSLHWSTPQLGLVVEYESPESNTGEIDDLSLSGRKFMYHMVQHLVVKGKGALARMRENQGSATESAVYGWIDGPYIPRIIHVPTEDNNQDGSI